jgi:spermidine synthase
MVTPIYFTHGKLLAESGNMRVYLFNGLLHLEEGHTLWAIEDEIHQYKEQIKDYPHGKCLEVGLGLGVASRYILSCEGVESLTTVELQKDVIKVQKQTNFIDDDRHTIICMDGWKYIISTDKKYDFIFMDFYHFIDEDGLPIIEEYVEVCKKRILKEKGKIVGWFDLYTPEEFIEPFYDLFK